MVIYLRQLAKTQLQQQHDKLGSISSNQLKEFQQLLYEFSDGHEPNFWIQVEPSQQQNTESRAKPTAKHSEPSRAEQLWVELFVFGVIFT